MTTTVFRRTTAWLLLATAVPAFATQIDGIALHPQEQTNWCWAAVTQTVVQQNRGRSDAQCRMASRFIAGDANDYCCSGATGAYARCNQPYYPSETMGHYGVLDKYWATPIAQSQLAGEVRQGYPVAFSVMWSGGGGHALLFYGAGSYVSNGQTVETVNIWDPGNGGDKVVMSRHQAENYQGGRWTRTFTSKCPNNVCGQG